MKIRIPKDMRGSANPHIFTITQAGFDIEQFLPSLFFLLRSEGVSHVKTKNSATAIDKYVDELTKHPDLDGFNTIEGRRLLGRLVRTEMVSIGKVGRTHKGEQILSVKPYTFLSYKAGFPVETSHQRGVGAFLYNALLRTLQRGSTNAFAAKRDLTDQFKQAFGKGVAFDGPPMYDGTYDGKTGLDTLTRLSIAFLDGFVPTSVGKSSRQQYSPACPSGANELGEDILRYLFVYANRMPKQTLTNNVLALINFELFIYTLKLIYAINDLVTNHHILPPAMRDTFEASPPHLYFDFVEGQENSLSHTMTTSCVRRDIEAYQKFLWSNILLRQLRTYVEQSRRLPARAARIEAKLEGVVDGPDYLQRLLMLRDEANIGDQIENFAINDENRIRQEHGFQDDEEDNEALAGLDEIAAGYESYMDRVVALLVEGQKDQALSNYLKWFRSVGGLTKPYGILAGNTRGRISWRYAPTNDLLAVLVQLAAIRQPAQDIRDAYGNVIIQPIRLQDFLAFLEQRFGILVDRPSAPFSGAEATAAARENLGAMLRRLRQMGIFSDLSDDFTVQRLQPPYANVSPIRAEV